MRIIGYIDHPVLKITIFQMDNKYSVKFESGLYEQTYKFREAENVNDVRSIVDETFTRQVEAALQSMHRLRMEALNRFQEEEGEEEFERII